MLDIPVFLKNDSEFFETIMHELSLKSYDLFVNKYQIDSLEKFMALKTENLISMKNCGYKTIREVRRIQNTIIGIIKIIFSRNDIKFNGFKSMIKLDRNIRDLLNIEEDIDPEKPFASLNNKGCKIWITGSIRGAASATVAADRDGNVEGGYTFGFPQVGDSAFKNNFEDEANRMVNHIDIVT